MSSPGIPEIIRLFPFEKDPTLRVLRTNPAFIFLGVLLESLGQEPLVSGLWTYISKVFPYEDDQLHVARRLREGFLKGSALVGFPRGINSLTALKSAMEKTSPAVLKQLNAERSVRQSKLSSRQESAANGKAFFTKVYKQHSDDILESMSNSSNGDLSRFVIESVYGDLLSETSILDERETGLLEFLCCYATGAAPQAKGHMYGCMNLGAKREDVVGVIRMTHALAQVVDVEIDRDEDEEDWEFLKKIRKG
jgi:alkylhydroperoxidase/carboxymuconolactone decarboxylase family protein YurZ